MASNERSTTPTKSPSPPPPQAKDQRSITGLLQRLATGGRTRSSSSLGNGHPENAQERLQSILNSAPSGRKHSASSDLSKNVLAAASRSVSGLSNQSTDDVESKPQDAPSLEAIIHALQNAIAEKASSARKIELVNQLNEAVRVQDEGDPVSIWTAVSALISPTEHVDIRLVALNLLATCIRVSQDSPAPKSGDRLFFYSAICQYQVDLKQQTDHEMDALCNALSELCKGGRNIHGLDDLLELLCSWAGELFKRRQSRRDRIKEQFYGQAPGSGANLSPLQDPTFSTPFVVSPTHNELLDRGNGTSSLSLITNIHKFSWPHLPGESISFATAYLIAEGLATSNERVVLLVLEHIDSLTAYGYIQTSYTETVVHLVARVVSIEGRTSAIQLTDTKHQPTEPFLRPSLPELPQKARQVMHNLLRSPNNQALRYLRAATIPPPRNEVADIQIVSGSLKCLRQALIDYRVSAGAADWAASESFHAMLSMGIPFLYDNLVEALEWDAPEVGEEVLGIVSDRIAWHKEVKAVPKSGANTPAGREGGATAETLRDASKRLESDDEEGWIGYDEWDMILGLVEGSLKYLWAPDQEGVTWALNLSGQEEDSEGSTLSPVLTALQHVLAAMVSVFRAGTFEGPLDRFFPLLASLESSLSDQSAVALLECYHAENVCMPSNPDWLTDLYEVSGAFLIPSRSATSRPAAKMRAIQLLADVYETVQDFDEYRDSALHQVILPLIDKLLKAPEFDLTCGPRLIALIKIIATDYLASQTPEQAASEQESPILHSLEESLVFLAKTKSAAIKTVVSKAHLRSTSAPLNGKGIQPLSSSSTPNGSTLPRSKAPSPVFCEPDASTFAISALLGIFGIAVDIGSRPAALHAVHLARRLLLLLSPEEDEPSPLSRLSRFTVLQWFLRLRARPDHRVFIERDVDIAGLASGLHRPSATSEQAFSESESSRLSESLHQDDNERKRGRTPRQSAASPDRNGRSSRSGSRTGRANDRNQSVDETDATSFLWCIPEIPPYNMAHESGGRADGLVSFDHTVEWEESDNANPDELASPFPYYDLALAARTKDAPIILPVSEYFKVLLRVLQNTTDWEIASYILCHLPSQLSCKHFTAGPRASREIHALRRFFCEGLLRGRVVEKLRLPPNIKNDSVSALSYQTLVTLIAYKSLFTKGQQDEIVSTLCHGLSQRELAKPCVHALAIACHELPPSTMKYMTQSLRNLHKVMSTASMAVHILELIASVGLIPALYSNFTESDYSAVFGIALQYISTHNQNLSTERPQSETNSTDKKDDLVFAFSQYVFHLAFYVIDLWYMSLKQPQRRQYVPFITNKLVQACEARGSLDEPSEVCLDMIARYAYSNVDPRPRKLPLRDLLQRGSARAGKGPITSDSRKSWVSGHSLITITLLSINGWADITIRRPSGVVSMVLEVENSLNPGGFPYEDLLHMLVRRRDSEASEWKYLQGNTDKQGRPRDFAPIDAKRSRSNSFSTFGQVAADASVRSAVRLQEPSASSLRALAGQPASAKPSETTTMAQNQAVKPSFFALQFSSLPDFGEHGPPLPVPDEPAYQRAISMMDSIPVLDFHKVGVVYVGSDDYTEQDILANSHGSKEYVKFLSGLGQLVELADHHDFYVGGLDTENDVDGRWAYIWFNNVAQIVYHVATLMPTDLQADPQCTLKKRHIGNDFTKIIYNDSGRPFAQDTLPGQFNFVNIVIEPQTPAGKAWSASGMQGNMGFFKVSMQRRRDMPEIGPLGVFKMVSAASLPQVVRHLALHANVFALVFLESVGVEGSSSKRQRSEFVSNWRHRLTAIKKLKSRIISDGKAPSKVDEDGRALSGFNFTTWTTS